MWDCGILSRPNYRLTTCVPLVTLPAVAGDAYNLSYCHKHDLLLAGCDAALLLYTVDLEKIFNKERWATLHLGRIFKKCIIIYNDFLPPPRRGSHVKSDNTHTIINIHPLANILDICALIYSSCALFTFIPTPSCNGVPPLYR